MLRWSPISTQEHLGHVGHDSHDPAQLLARAVHMRPLDDTSGRGRADIAKVLNSRVRGPGPAAARPAGLCRKVLWPPGTAPIDSGF